MKLVIAGCRDFDDYELLSNKIDAYIKTEAKDEKITIISGGADGADKLGEKYSKDNCYDLDVHSADWKKFGKAAGPIRNERMAQVADAVVVFWDGKSRGTKNMIDNAKKYDRPCLIINF